MMERVTFEGNFCNIAQCHELPCPGYCDQRRCYEKLREYERTGLTPEQIKELQSDWVTLKAARLDQQWISINDRLPSAKDCNNIVVLALKQGIVKKLPCIARFNGCDWVQRGQEVTVTHWMPLPEPPKEEHDGK